MPADPTATHLTKPALLAAIRAILRQDNMAEWWRLSEINKLVEAQDAR